VVSVWGMGGLGKTTLVRSIYRSQELGGWKRAWATALRPFKPEVLLRDLALQLQITIQEDPTGATTTGRVMNLHKLKQELDWVLKLERCLIVLDDISSSFEWDLVKQCLHKARRIIVTTREKDIAKHCSIDDENMYHLGGLKVGAALDLFKKKVILQLVSFLPFYIGSASRYISFSSCNIILPPCQNIMHISFVLRQTS
jgi:hypothetical protein